MPERAPSPPEAESRPIRIGVSACLLGEKVRYDGGHKRDPFVTGTLGQLVEFVPVCPEFEVGLGVPRETLRLVRGEEGETRLVAPRSNSDHTTKMQRYARKRTAELGAEDLCGFLLKKDSPSCGLFRVRLYSAAGMPSKTGQGLFAAALAKRYPMLPVEEEGRLHDPRLRDNFFVRIFAYRRLEDLFQGRWRMGDLVSFHTREKLLLLAHEETSFRRLGRLVASGKSLPRAQLATEYQQQFMGALQRLSTVRRNVNVLQHVHGFFKKQLDASDREELLQTIEDYRHGLVPLIVPITVVRHHVRRLKVDYLAGQSFLAPHPRELMLRNHV